MNAAVFEAKLERVVYGPFLERRAVMDELRLEHEHTLWLLNQADGQLGLAAYRGEHGDEWKREAKELSAAIRRHLKADG